MTNEELIARVKVMRELGITECDGIRLGAPPPPPPSTRRERTPEEQEKWSKAWAEYHEQMQFAHVEGLPDEPAEPEYL